MSRKIGKALSRATLFRHSAVLSLPIVLLCKLPKDGGTDNRSSRSGWYLVYFFLRRGNFKYLGEKPQNRVKHEQKSHSTIAVRVESGMQLKEVTLIEDRFSYKSIIWAPPPLRHQQTFLLIYDFFFKG